LGRKSCEKRSKAGQKNNTPRPRHLKYDRADFAGLLRHGAIISSLPKKASPAFIKLFHWPIPVIKLTTIINPVDKIVFQKLKQTAIFALTNVAEPIS